MSMEPSICILAEFDLKNNGALKEIENYRDYGFPNSLWWSNAEIKTRKTYLCFTIHYGWESITRERFDKRLADAITFIEDFGQRYDITEIHYSYIMGFD